MGFPLAPVGAAHSFIPGNENLPDKGHNQAYPVRSRRQSESRNSGEVPRDAPAAQSSTSASDNTGASGGFYQVAAGLVLQQQLYYLGTTGSAVANPAAGANQTTSDANAGDVPASGDSTATSTPSPGNTKALGAAGVAAAGTTAASQASSALQQEEAQLQQALQDLGLNPPAAIQEFMQAAQLLAEVAPGMFQEFVSNVTQLAEAAEPTVAASPASGAAAGATGAAGQAPAAGSASNAGAPQIQFEVGSIQVTQAEVSITPNQNGGETLSVAAQSETASFAELQLGSPAPTSASTSSATGNAGAENAKTPALSATA
ncbi:MAG: hypothetical protein ACRD1I_02655 [Terriglobia bacterium]